MFTQGHMRHVAISAVLPQLFRFFLLNGTIIAESGYDKAGLPVKPAPSNNGAVKLAGTDYISDSPVSTRFSVGEDTDRQYEKIIIRRMLRELDASPDSDLIINQPIDTTKPMFSFYGFNVIPETAVSTMILIGGLLIFRHRKRG